MSEEYKKYYIEGKNNINANNIEIYINNKKIEFNYKYKSNEKGRYLLEFRRTGGKAPSYYQHFLKIKEIVKKMKFVYFMIIQI